MFLINTLHQQKATTLYQLSQFQPNKCLQIWRLDFSLSFVIMGPGPCSLRLVAKAWIFVEICVCFYFCIHYFCSILFDINQTKFMCSAAICMQSGDKQFVIICIQLRLLSGRNVVPPYTVNRSKCSTHTMTKDEYSAYFKFEVI